ncbi:MAG: hypothetical protein HYY18_06690 [Planctomycetes bacterium]|nr:hypothetical protein [Planctomycetota bacterium]
MQNGFADGTKYEVCGKQHDEKQRGRLAGYGMLHGAVACAIHSTPNPS